MSAAKKFPRHINLSVLGYREEDEWVALALEMDLRGYGDTFEEAVGDLDRQIGIQISFARFKKDADLIFKMAEQKYVEIFSRLHQEFMRDQVMGRDVSDCDYDISDLPMPTADVIAKMKGKFEQVRG